MGNSRQWRQPHNERFHDYDPFTGKTTYFSDFEDGTWQYRYEFDPIQHEIEASKELAKNHDHWNKGVKDGILHYAHIPDAILFQWHCAGVDIKDNKELIKMVNKPEWAWLKTTTKTHA